MKEMCLDSGKIQAFLDGELAPATAESAAIHASACEACAQLLSETGQENELMFSVLSAEFSTLVPTERLRSRILDAIDVEKQSFWKRVFGVGWTLGRPTFAVYASLIILIGTVGIILLLAERPAVLPVEVARVESNKPVSSDHTVSTNPDVSSYPVEDNRRAITIVPRRPGGEQTVYKSESRRVQIQKAYFTPDTRRPGTGAAGSNVANGDSTKAIGFIPGEVSYIQTIATLTKAVESRKDDVLRPSQRVAFERDLAVVDDAISKLRSEVRRNPKNEAAGEVLRASYQNKINLLSSVADHNELMAAR
jgi:anti-sigma factor RsiW